MAMEPPNFPLDLPPLGGGVGYWKLLHNHWYTPPLGGGMCVYSATLSTIILAMEIQAGGGGWLVAALYHTCICHHVYFTQGGSDARKESNSSPISAVLCFIPPRSSTLILRPTVLVLALLHVRALWRLTLASTAIKISDYIHGALRISDHCGFGMSRLRSTNSTSSRIETMGGRRGSCMRRSR